MSYWPKGEIGKLLDEVRLEADHARALELDALPPRLRDWMIWRDTEIARVMRERALYGYAILNP